MMWIKSLIGARWFPYALIGIPAVVAALFGWGYLKGYNTAEASVQARIDSALLRQREEMIALQAKDLATVVRAEIHKSEVNRRVDEIQRPTVSTGDLGPDWLRAYTDGVRAANAGPGTVNF